MCHHAHGVPLLHQLNWIQAYVFCSVLTMTVTYLIRPSVCLSVCLSVTLSKAMFRRRHMYSLECCHYFFVVIMSKVPYLIIMPREIDIARHFILSSSFSRSKSRFATCDMTVAFREHKKFPCLKLIENCYIVGLLHHPFWLPLILAPFGHYFSIFEITLFGWGSLAGVRCPKCEYGPYR